MAIVNGYTAEKMNEFGNASVISGAVNSSGSLILKTRGGTNIDAGNVKGAKGDVGPVGITGGSTAARDLAFGKPTTVTASVTLANKVPTWFNTTTGLIETYYAKSGSAGLLVPGVPGAYGWYENQYLADSPKGQIDLSYINEKSTRFEPPNNDTWYLTESLIVSLVAGRRYRVNYKCSSIAASGSMAIGMMLKVSSTTDKSPSGGTSIEEALTVYAAPTAFQGKFHMVDFHWTAPTTGTFLLKLSTIRSTLTGYYYFQNRRFTLYDEGNTQSNLIITNPL